MVHHDDRGNGGRGGGSTHTHSNRMMMPQMTERLVSLACDRQPQMLESLAMPPTKPRMAALCEGKVK